MLRLPLGGLFACSVGLMLPFPIELGFVWLLATVRAASCDLRFQFDCVLGPLKNAHPRRLGPSFRVFGVFFFLKLMDAEQVSL